MKKLMTILLLNSLVLSLSFADPSIDMAVHQGELMVGDFAGSEAERSIAIGLSAAGFVGFKSHTEFLCKSAKKTILCKGVLALSPKKYFNGNLQAARFFSAAIQVKSGLPITAREILSGDYDTFADISAL